MLSSRLFWRIFGAYAALFSLSSIVLVVVLSSRQHNVETAHVLQKLRNAAVMLRADSGPRFTGGPSGELQSRLQAVARNLDVRLTLVAADGTVVGDSAEEPQVMDNHRNRDELIQARISGEGRSERPSPTLGIPMMYYALRVGSKESPVGFVRAAMPMSSVEQQVRSVQKLIWWSTFSVSLVALLLTWLVVGRIIRPLAQLTGAAQAMAHGELSQEVDAHGKDELGTLGRSFNAMSAQLATRVAELQSKQRELEENSRLLETVLGAMSDGVLLIDEGQRLLYANDAACRLLAVEREGAMGRPLWETARYSELERYLANLLSEQTVKPIKLEIPRRQSVISLSASRVAAIVVPGASAGAEACPGVVLVLQDVTEERRLEKMRREFVSNVSHELKTPLTSIQAYTETLLAGAIDDADHNREFLQQIDEQAGRLHLQILDLLTLARIESGRSAFEIVPTAVGPVVSSCTEAHRTLADSRRISLELRPGQNDLQALVDAEGLRTILDNLVDNAINYTPENGRVEVGIESRNGTVRIAIADDGPGIAEEHQGRVFERFYRVDKARSRELGGTGLGLSIVKHLAQVFDGSVELDTRPGKGSTFTVCLPSVDNPTS